MPRLEFRPFTALLRTGSTPTDNELLARFAAKRDEAAFAALVVRHGGLVLGTARRYLRDRHTAEDVCQATFLVLARKARLGRWGATVGPWLHATAVRLARKAGRGRPHTGPVDVPAAGPDPVATAVWCEISRAVDEELLALPAALRSPLVLCYFQGHTRDEAAELLGCSLAMLKRRLERGRNLLRDRLARRGVGLPAVGLGVLVTDAAIGTAEAESTARAASAYVTSGTAPADLATLLGGRIGWIKSVAVVLGLVACGVGLVGATGRPEKGQPPATKTDSPDQPKTARLDRFGDPLPAGAVARLGTTRHRAAGAHVAVTPDGKRVVTAGDDLVVRVFDAMTGDTLETRTLDGPPTYHSALSADGRYLVGVGFASPETAEVQVWDLTTGKPAGRLPLGREPVSALGIHAGTTTVAFIRGPQTFPPTPQKLFLWNFAAKADPTELRRFNPTRERYGEPRTLFSADGSKLLAHQTDGQLVCWDVKGQKALWEKQLKYLKFFLFSSDGTQVVLKSNSPGFEVLSAADGMKANRPAWTGNGVRDPHNYWPVAASGRSLALFYGQRRVALFDTVKKAVVRELDDPLREPGEEPAGFWAVPTNFAFTPDGTGFVWRSPTLQRWDVATGKALWPVTWDQGHTEAVTRLLFTPDGSSLVSADYDRAYYVWDQAPGRPRYRLAKWYASLVAFTPNSRSLLTSSRTADRLAPLAVWDLQSGKETGTLKGNKSLPQYGSGSDREAAVTPDGKHLVTLTDNHTGNERIPPGRYLTVWDLATRKVIKEEMVGPRERTTVLAPGGGAYAAVSQDPVKPGVRLVATMTGKELGWLREDEFPKGDAPRAALEMVFSPDGRLIATRVFDDGGTAKSAGDRPVRVWDVGAARLLAEFPTSGPARFAFAPDGRTLVIAGSDGFRAVEIATRKEIQSVTVTGPPRSRKPGAFATALAVGPGGRTVATGHHDGTILMWDAIPRQISTAPLDGDAAWKALADPDAKAGRLAAVHLADNADLALRLFADRLKPGAPAPQAAALVKRLDSDDFKEREAAEGELRALGTRAEPALTAALTVASPELKNRVTRLLAALSPATPASGEDLQDIRAVEVLESIGTAPARQLLTRLATGSSEVRLTQEAKKALARLGE